MKYWTSDALANAFRKISERADRISHEFDMGHPDLGVCDRLLKSIFTDVGEILRKRKEHGWPK